MKYRMNPSVTKHKSRSQKKRERRIILTVTAGILIAAILLASFLINSILDQPSISQTIGTSEPKVAIVDQLSLTFPNRTFINTTTDILKQAGYTVDYYPGEKVTVEFYRELPTHGYGLVILRVHSSAALLQGSEHVEAPVSLFTAEEYTENKYVWEQLTDQLLGATITLPTPQHFFAITPNFITKSMRGEFQDALIIMMGCEGLVNTKMAEAFIEKGAKIYVGWDGAVQAGHTDHATTRLLEYLISNQQTVEQAVMDTMTQVGRDPVYESILLTYDERA